MMLQTSECSWLNSDAIQGVYMYEALGVYRVWVRGDDDENTSEPFCNVIIKSVYGQKLQAFLENKEVR